MRCGLSAKIRARWVVDLTFRYDCRLDLEKNTKVRGMWASGVVRYVPLYSSEIQRANSRLNALGFVGCVMDYVKNEVMGCLCQGRRSIDHGFVCDA